MEEKLPADKLVAALVQARLEWENVPANLERFDERLEKAAGAELIVLPELFASGFSMEAKVRVASFYEEIVGKMLGWSARYDALLVGSTVYRAGDLFFNRLVATFPDGDARHYDKRHRFAMGGEDRHFAAGREQVILLYKGIKIAPFICYDLRFPVWSRNTAGYDAAIYVANWPESRREAWQVLLKARAIENQAYAIGVNRVGTDGHGARHAGDSAVISPKGERVGGVDSWKDEVALVEMDMAAARDFRQRFPVLRDGDSFQVER
ncbi:MAG: amidohydrolase [Odoribacteraceae bacterium]|jgi:predicted amidohydrolase|nr:amidohydrolase [Odoribacteraceae bacterium]